MVRREPLGRGDERERIGSDRPGRRATRQLRRYRQRELAGRVQAKILDDIFLAYEQLLGNKFFSSTGRGLQLPLSHCKFKVFRPCSSHPVGLDFDDAFGS